MVSYKGPEHGHHITSHTVNLGTRMEDLSRVVGEPREVNTIFLASNRFGIFALFHVVSVNAFIATSADQIIALVIKV